MPTEEEQEKKNLELPDTINYSTGALLVDVKGIKGWSGTNPKYYYEMLYSFDGTDIRHLPIGSANWPQQLRTMFVEINKSEKEPKEPWRKWANKLSRQSGGRKRGGRILGGNRRGGKDKPAYLSYY